MKRMRCWMRLTGSFRQVVFYLVQTLEAIKRIAGLPEKRPYPRHNISQGLFLEITVHW